MQVFSRFTVMPTQSVVLLSWAMLVGFWTISIGIWHYVQPCSRTSMLKNGAEKWLPKKRVAKSRLGRRSSPKEGENSQMEGADFASQKFAKFCNILFCTKIPFNPTRNRQRQW